MRIVYLNGPYRKLSYSRSSRSPAVTKSGTVYYPIWLAYAAGYAHHQNETCLDGQLDIDLVDAIAKKYSIGDLIEYFKASPPDVVFCDTSTPSIYEDIDTACAIKQAFNECKIVMVGTHATACYDEVLDSSHQIDAVVLGELDITCFEYAKSVLEGKACGNIAGLAFRKGDSVIKTPQRELLQNLDELPYIGQIYRDYLDIRDYVFAAAQFPMLMIITSRGCPHSCKWCLYPQVMHRGKYRARSAQSVADEFAWIAHNMPDVREIGIEDDLFTGDRRRLKQICDLLIEQGNKINFWCDTRVDLDYESMVLLKKAGCRLLITGFESADKAVLDNINKGIVPSQSYEFVANAHKAGILVHGCFVLGNPGETHHSMLMTLEMAKDLEPDTAQFFPMMVYPGTNMYEWAKGKGYLKTDNYTDWLTPEGLHSSVVDMPEISSHEVVQFCDDARRDFYLRRKYMFRKLVQSVTNIHEARRNVKAFCRVAKHLVGA